MHIYETMGVLLWSGHPLIIYILYMHFQRPTVLPRFMIVGQKGGVPGQRALNTQQPTADGDWHK